MDVSIIIPVYNAKDFILSCLKSVANQTYKGRIECIIIDDCGSDDSVRIIETYIDEQPSSVYYKLFHQPYNQGPSAARNRGIRESQGDYIFFLDADDEITPHCLESLYSLAKVHKLDYVQGTYQGNHNRIFDSSLLDNNNCLLDLKGIKRTLLNYNIIPYTPHNRLVRRQMLIDNNLFFNEEIWVREDFLWMTFVAKYVKRMGCSHEVTYIRGYNEDSLTHNINIERDIKGYRVLIETMAANLDPFLIGEQKELLLSTLIMCIDSEYYHSREEKKHLIDVVKRQNSIIENILLSCYLKTKNAKILHTLIRLYKYNG